MKYFYTKIGILAALSIGTIFTSNVTLPKIKESSIEKSHSNISNNIASESIPSVFAVYFEARTKGTGASGTGFAIEHNNELLIVTNQHVVPFDDQEYFLITHDHEKYKAKLIYSNKEDDVAFLKLNQKVNIPPLKLQTDVSDIKLGDSVFTIGNPYDFLFSYSSGVVSNLNEDVVFEDGDFDELLIQTTINVNPGNSGGPLLNDKGEVLGIVSSMLEDSIGMSFAIPSDLISKHLEKIK